VAVFSKDEQGTVFNLTLVKGVLKIATAHALFQPQGMKRGELQDNS